MLRLQQSMPTFSERDELFLRDFRGSDMFPNHFLDGPVCKRDKRPS